MYYCMVVGQRLLFLVGLFGFYIIIWLINNVLVDLTLGFLKIDNEQIKSLARVG